MRKETQRAPVDVEQLLSDYKLSHDSAILDTVVESHLYIASIIARRFSGRGVDNDDLYQVAALAMVKAVDRFDPERGIKFASFVTPTMVGEVKNYFRDRTRIIRLPRRGGQLIKQIDNAREALMQSLMRQPTMQEIASELGISMDEVIEVHEMRGAASPVSLDSMPLDDEDSAPLSTYMGVEEEGYTDFERNDMLTRAMSSLTEKQKDVIRMRFFDGRTQREVAESMDVSQMWVSRTERKALAILQDEMLTERTEA